MTRFFFTALLAGSVLAPLGAADPAPLARGELDKRAAAAAFDAVSQGVELFNAGKHDECLRVYEGALAVLKSLFDHHPALMKSIADKMDFAKDAKTAVAKAFILREALDAVIDLGAKKKPLWERLGGEPAVKAVVHDFVMAAATDPKVNFLRDGKYKLDAKGVAALEAMLVDLVSATSGGPRKYVGRNMKTTHAGMKITEAEFDALVAVHTATLQKFKVPKAEMDELTAIILSTKADIVEVKK